MARYFKHRDTQPIETYAPINLKFMDEKLKGKQAKTDRVKKLTRDASNLELSGDAIQKYEYSGAESEDMKVRNNVLNEWREQQKNVTDMMLNSDGTNEDQILDTIYNMKNYKDKMEQGILSRLSENKKQYLDTRKTIAELEYLSNSDKQVKREEMERRYVKAGEGNGLEDSGAYNEYGNYDETKRVNLGNLMTKAGKDINIDETKGGYSRFMGSYIRHDTHWSKTRSPVKITQVGLMQIQSNNDMLNTVNDFINTKYNKIKFAAMKGNDKTKGKTEKEANAIAEAAVANERAAMNMNYYLKDSGKKKDGKAIMELDMSKFDDTYVGRSIKQSILANAKNDSGKNFTLKDNFLYNQAAGMTHDDKRRLESTAKTGMYANENYTTESFIDAIAQGNTTISELEDQIANTTNSNSKAILQRKLRGVQVSQSRRKTQVYTNYKNNGLDVYKIAESMYRPSTSSSPYTAFGEQETKEQGINKIVNGILTEGFSNYIKSYNVTTAGSSVGLNMEPTEDNQYYKTYKKYKDKINKAETNFVLSQTGTLHEANDPNSYIKQLATNTTNLYQSTAAAVDHNTGLPIPIAERKGKNLEFTTLGTEGDYTWSEAIQDEEGNKIGGRMVDLETDDPILLNIGKDKLEQSRMTNRTSAQRKLDAAIGHNMYTNYYYKDEVMGMQYQPKNSEVAIDYVNNKGTNSTLVYKKVGSEYAPVWELKTSDGRAVTQGNKPVIFTSAGAVKQDISKRTGLEQRAMPNND